MAAFDHIAVSAETLEAGVAHVEEILGVSLEAGGKHPHMGTHNRLLSLGRGEYLEVIAIDPDAMKPTHPRWFALDDFAGVPRLTNWIVRVDDLDAALAGAPRGAGRPTDLARGDFRWRFAVPEDGYLPYDNAFPALIEWQSAHPADRLTDTGCRLIRLEIAHPEAKALGAALPLSDPRIVVVPGAKEMRATIATPHGERVLT
ncbi:VOC family protein [Defluviimonas sp. WL0050]|uniref:VOC family protein n=1 Tax=Albidovulum litorale TaxID=2984134 RepID=A0ABT2ZJR2_9RHOB|nr:VOC family protein [Defluviimonas sp. WL0050]MCV2871359.1 VOC family protein [Defluviimonas sp. WL0050]